MTTIDRDRGAPRPSARTRTSRIRCVHAALMVWVALLALPTVARGQSSGGAMGGGVWGSSSSSHSYSDDSGGGGYSSGGSDYSSGGDYSGGGGGYRDGGGAGGCNSDASDVSGGITVVVVLVAGLLLFAAWRDSTRIAPTRPSYGIAPHRDLVSQLTDVTMLRVVLDARVRVSVQAALAQIAATAATGDAEGRARMLGEVTLLLRRHRAMWLLGAASNHPMTTLDESRATFQRQALAARSTYRDETIRNTDGRITTASSDAIRRYEEGPGVILVSIIVAARRELVTVTTPGDGDSLRRAHEALGSLTPSTLIAVEVVWTPTDPDDRMTSTEAEQILRAADGTYAAISGAAIGVEVCLYCQQLTPAEAITCVHCGAAPQDARRWTP